LGDELQYLLRNPILLIEFEMWIHRKGKNLRCNSFRDGKIPALIAKSPVSFLAMEGHGIVDSSGDLGGEQIGPEPVSVVDADYIQVVDSSRP
jgi:hypothetical protein